MTGVSFIERAIRLARESVKVGGFPVGAVVVMAGEIVGEGISNGKKLNDATSHAEIAAIRAAESKIGKRDLKGAVIYSSLEPCLMCFSACYWAKISKVIFACGRNVVPKIHYEGNHNLDEINSHSNRQIEFVHDLGYQESALEVIKVWEFATRSTC